MFSLFFVVVGSAPGTRYGPGDPTAPALRAPFRCSLQAGSAQTRFAQTRAALFPPEAALLSGAEGIARPAPHAGLRGVQRPTAPPTFSATPTCPRRRAVCPGPAVEAPPSSAAVRGKRAARV